MGVDEVKLKVVESCIVTPSEETPRHALWLSSLDVTMSNTGYTPTAYCYRPESGVHDDDFFDVPRVKAAMAKALVAFYPLAGRLGMDGNGRLEIDCAGQGALFVVARSDLTVDLSNFEPSQELRNLLVPPAEDYPGLLCAIQVAFFKSGGVILGTALHHSAIDAVSAFHFFQTWSAFCRDGDNAAAVLGLPCHDRTLLRARSPPILDPSELPSSGLPVVRKVFDFSKDQVTAVKRACGGGVSTFCALSAHVWQCVCAARRLPADATTLLTFLANIRSRLSPPLPGAYFGNGIITMGSSCEVREITSEAVASVAERIKGVIRRMDDELVRSAIDYLELDIGNSPPPPQAPGLGGIPGTGLSVVSWLGMGMCDADFGWGKPLGMTSMRAGEGRAGYVYLLDNDGDGGGGVRVLVFLEAAFLDDFQRLLCADFL
ncbi:hypothetical protein BRADI_4g24425v3 [Brachypodium distachyon]|uniref:Uncharacterized protein n=1 Tax=Brachypodium distachyon TaxID=15368 RepID=A0A0Q3ENZ6_BRADI|nr:hypothetical protein BRADI_4g24425v3 [Brachypodium distachyon]